MLKEPLFSDFSLIEYQMRCKKARRLMERCNLDALLLSQEENLRYFTGYNTIYWDVKLDFQLFLLTEDSSIEASLMLPLHLAGVAKTTWVEDIRHWAGEGPQKMGDLRTDASTLVVDTLKEKGLAEATIGMELGVGGRLGMSQVQFEAIKKGLPRANIVDACELIWKLRSIKSEAEIKMIRKACDISCKGYKAGLESLKEGMTEKELAHIICKTMLEEGADDAGSRHPWMLIMQSGPRASWCDAVPSNYKLKRGDLIMIDGGAIYKGYHSDFVRMGAIGKPTKEQRKMFETSLKANKAAIEAIRPGVPCAEIFEAGTRVVKKAGYEKNVIDRINLGYSIAGHGIGLDIHEPPIPRAENMSLLKPGMVMAIEIFVTDTLPFEKTGNFLLVENVVLVTEDGHEVLTLLKENLWIV